MQLNTLAKIGYVAYGNATGNKNFRGEPMPQWSDLPEAIIQAWVAAAQQIVKMYEFGKTQEVIASGWGGLLPNGNIVDRRIHPEAIAVQPNSLLGAPQPKE